MNAQKIAGLLFAGWAMLSLSACGFRYYQVVSQPTTPSGDIKNSQEFKVRPISYAKISYKDLGYDSEAKMKEEFVNFAPDFQSHFKDMWKTEGVPEKKVTMVGATDEVADGILVETQVDRIQLNWNMWSNNPDDFFVTVTFIDAAKKVPLYTGSFQVKNTSNAAIWSGGWSNVTFGNRLNSAAYNIVWVLIKIMSKGVADPAQY
jgi:hypothetical protein